MRVCDRHNRKLAAEVVHIKSTDTYFDLCESCANEALKFLSDKKKETVVPKPKRKLFGK